MKWYDMEDKLWETLDERKELFEEFKEWLREEYDQWDILERCSEDDCEARDFFDEFIFPRRLDKKWLDRHGLFHIGHHGLDGYHEYGAHKKDKLHAHVKCIRCGWFGRYTDVNSVERFGDMYDVCPGCERVEPVFIDCDEYGTYLDEDMYGLRRIVWPWSKEANGAILWVCLYYDARLGGVFEDHQDTFEEALAVARRISMKKNDDIHLEIDVPQEIYPITDPNDPIAKIWTSEDDVLKSEQED